MKRLIPFLILLSGGCYHDHLQMALDAARRAATFDLQCDDAEATLITRGRDSDQEVFEVGTRGCGQTHTYRVSCYVYDNSGCRMAEDRVRSAEEED